MQTLNNLVVFIFVLGLVSWIMANAAAPQWFSNLLQGVG